jgi:hypothetical protein
MLESVNIGLPTCGSLTLAEVDSNKIDWSKLDWANVWQLVIAAAVLAVLVAVGIYVAGKVRHKAVQKEPPASELLTKFREMHSRGVLSDEEFRTIKTTLTERLQNELKDQNIAG